ncbi:MAG TPA: fumarylacetoacetase [Patescibacteria group bacterium]|nr:fumarylacetoacetase [Patescibacteria group bacterium]
MEKLNETHDPAVRSWVPAANQEDGDFPIQNLPFGVFRQEGSPARGGVAIGDQIFDLAAGLEAGLFTGEAAEAARAAGGPALNPLMALGLGPASALRARLFDLLRADGRERSRVEPLAKRLLVPMSSVQMQLPVKVNNFTDFICSSYHALRYHRLPVDSPLSPVLCHMPVAYNGRASSVRISGEPMRRPNGQSKPEGEEVRFGPSKDLDFELEVGAFIASENALGSPVPIEAAPSHIFGFCLLNDWSARDIQRWESRLGPFLSKSASTTISPWVVTAEALAPFHVPVYGRPAGCSALLPYLFSKTDQAEGAMDINLEAFLLTPRMREKNEPPARVTKTNFRHAYWTFAQMVAHHTSNGCNLQPGDLLGSGTVSGPTDESAACLAEHAKPFALPNGEMRHFLEDGDEVVFRGRARREGYVSIGLGECRGRITPAPA